jgi:vacuolar protein sorting-associated protein 13A/C
LGTTGVLQDFINFFSGFANISDASIYFTQIDISNSYRTQQSIVNLLSKHYIKQGISQVYKILGATDIVGNPVGLISNLGRGVEELYSEPFQGVLSGNMSNAAKGLGRGVVGFTKKTAFGVSNSVSKMTGTWYVGLRGFSGRQVSESNLDNPHSITSGLGNGAKSLGKELV